MVAKLWSFIPPVFNPSAEMHAGLVDELAKRFRIVNHRSQAPLSLQREISSPAPSHPVEFRNIPSSLAEADSSKRLLEPALCFEWHSLLLNGEPWAKLAPLMGRLGFILLSTSTKKNRSDQTVLVC